MLLKLFIRGRYWDPGATFSRCFLLMPLFLPVEAISLRLKELDQEAVLVLCILWFLLPNVLSRLLQRCVQFYLFHDVVEVLQVKAIIVGVSSHTARFHRLIIQGVPKGARRLAHFASKFLD